LIKPWTKDSRVVYLSLKSPVWKLDPLDFAVWLAIASFGNKRGVFVWPGDDALTQRAGLLTSENMRNGLKSLTAIGAIRSQPSRNGAYQLKRQVAVNPRWGGVQVADNGTKTARAASKKPVDADGQKQPLALDNSNHLCGTKATTCDGQIQPLGVVASEVLTSEVATLEGSSAKTVCDRSDVGGLSETRCRHQKEDPTIPIQSPVGEVATESVRDLPPAPEQDLTPSKDPLGWQAPSAVEAMTPEEYAEWTSSDWLYGPDVTQNAEFPQSVQAAPSPQAERASEAPTLLEPIPVEDIELAPAAVTSAPVVVDGRDGPLVGQGGVSGAEVGNTATCKNRGLEGISRGTDAEGAELARQIAALRAHRAATVAPLTSNPDA
jgi:hypothetical protein